jgi:hypothetical protein
LKALLVSHRPPIVRAGAGAGAGAGWRQQHHEQLDVQLGPGDF